MLPAATTSTTCHCPMRNWQCLKLALPPAREKAAPRTQNRSAQTANRAPCPPHARPTPAACGVQYEFVITAPGYAITRIYQSAFARSSGIVHLRAERLPKADKAGAASITLARPRGCFDAQRDRMLFDGSTTLPSVPAQVRGSSAQNCCSRL